MIACLLLHSIRRPLYAEKVNEQEQFISLMKVFTAFLMVCLLGVFTMNAQGTVHDPARHHAMQSVEMNMTGHMQDHSKSDAMMSGMTQEDCCKQECHCDVSMCHGSLFVLSHFTHFTAAVVVSDTINTISEPLTAHGGPPFKPPIRLS